MVSVVTAAASAANSAGTAIVLVTYDAMYVADSGWSINKNKTFGAIWPENTGVVVVEVGKNAATGPDANMTINNGDRKVAGNKLDAEADVLYYTMTPAASTPSGPPPAAPLPCCAPPSPRRP